MMESSSARAPNLSDVEEIRVRLEKLADECAHAGNRLGYFTASYVETTTRVLALLRGNEFEAPDQVLALTVGYARRFLKMVADFRAGQPIARCWRLAIEAGTNKRLSILQHLLLGMNAHINYDLGIVAAQVSEDEAQLLTLRTDFLRINDLLAATLDTFQDRINRFSPVMRIIDRLGYRFDEAIFNFNLAHARDAAWSLATSLLALRNSEFPGAAEDALDVLDSKLAWLGRLLIDPGPVLRPAARAIRMFENQDVAAFLRTA